jgi:lipopolysaccharide export system permease protein
VRTIDRYLLREILLPFAIGLGLFFVVVAFAQVLKVSDSVTGLGITGGEILQALSYSLPPLMGLLIPVSGLFATLLGVGRLAADREVIGMAAAGMSPYALLRVPFAIGLVLAALSAGALILGEPWGVRGLRDLMSRSAQRALASGVRTGEFQEWVPGVTFLARGRDGDRLTEVVFADLREPETPVLISSRRGIIASGERARDLVFELEDGEVLLEDEQKGSHRVIRFERSHYRLDVGKLVGNKARTLQAVQELTLEQLWRASKNKKRNQNDRALYAITLHRKLALPFATVIFALLAVPLACRAQGGARARGFLYSAGIVGAYYYFGRAVELLARSGEYPATLAAWTPNLVGALALGLALWRFRRSSV